ncbi:hypothetical protein [Natranaerobius thermophilus]|uniref:Uncharacterized protein n=1 Tax=Natranaerobius thermophilus (strain ATCC BAA-1301 / DSM 18059 / JW/NM-WN-LF) TaxID=457570 RepID=B2A7C5_NATTJ|nr:hypothetical protein [Natranaerobius thermophilus]ACB84319.1 hypothetical protein Nther_0729 [Natranaerobius thermophilus JW/NM-WN-LF]
MIITRIKAIFLSSLIFFILLTVTACLGEEEKEEAEDEEEKPEELEEIEMTILEIMEQTDMVALVEEIEPAQAQENGEEGNGNGEEGNDEDEENGEEENGGEEGDDEEENGGEEEEKETEQITFEETIFMEVIQVEKEDNDDETGEENDQENDEEDQEVEIPESSEEIWDDIKISITELYEEQWDKLESELKGEVANEDLDSFEEVLDELTLASTEMDYMGTMKAANELTLSLAAFQEPFAEEDVSESLPDSYRLKYHVRDILLNSVVNDFDSADEGLEEMTDLNESVEEGLINKDEEELYDDYSLAFEDFQDSVEEQEFELIKVSSIRIMDNIVEMIEELEQEG